MTVLANMYGNALLKALNSGVNYTTDIIKVMLCTNAYVPDQDAHIYKYSVTGEVIGTGYTTGGETLSGKTMVYKGATNTIELDAYDVTWTNSTITARYAVIYDETTTVLLGYIDFGEDQVSSAGDFKITWDVAGIFQITVG